MTLNNQGQWAGAFENLAPGTYRVEESSVDGYTASYDPENQLVTFTADDLWAAPDNNNMTTFDNVKTYPVTITNTRNTVDLVAGSVKVTKITQGSSTDNDFSFTLKSATDDPNASKVIYRRGQQAVDDIDYRPLQRRRIQDQCVCGQADVPGRGGNVQVCRD